MIVKISDWRQQVLTQRIYDEMSYKLDQSGLYKLDAANAMLDVLNLISFGDAGISLDALLRLLSEKVSTYHPRSKVDIYDHAFLVTAIRVILLYQAGMLQP